MRLRLTERDAVVTVRELSRRAADLRIEEARRRDPAAGLAASELEAVICKFPESVSAKLRRLRRPPLCPKISLSRAEDSR